MQKNLLIKERLVRFEYNEKEFLFLFFLTLRCHLYFFFKKEIPYVKIYIGTNQSEENIATLTFRAG